MSIVKINLIFLLRKAFTEENDSNGWNHHQESVDHRAMVMVLFFKISTAIFSSAEGDQD
jgi:hypothetical protein